MEHMPLSPDMRQEIDGPARKALLDSIYRVQRYLQGEEMHDYDNNVIPEENRYGQYTIALKNIDDLQEVMQGSVMAICYRDKDLKDVALYSVRNVVMRRDDGDHLAIIYGQNGVGHSFSLRGLGDKFDLKFV